MLLVTLRNDYHGTQYRVKPTWYRPLTRFQIYNCRRALCQDYRTCTCGRGVLGQRGPQDVAVSRTTDVLGKTMVTIEPGPDTLSGR